MASLQPLNPTKAMRLVAHNQKRGENHSPSPSQDQPIHLPNDPTLYSVNNDLINSPFNSTLPNHSILENDYKNISLSRHSTIASHVTDTDSNNIAQMTRSFSHHNDNMNISFDFSKSSLNDDSLDTFQQPHPTTLPPLSSTTSLATTLSSTLSSITNLDWISDHGNNEERRDHKHQSTQQQPQHQPNTTSFQPSLELINAPLELMNDYLITPVVGWVNEYNRTHGGLPEGYELAPAQNCRICEGVASISQQLPNLIQFTNSTNVLSNDGDKKDKMIQEGIEDSTSTNLGSLKDLYSTTSTDQHNFTPKSSNTTRPSSNGTMLMGRSSSVHINTGLNSHDGHV